MKKTALLAAMLLVAACSNSSGGNEANATTTTTTTTTSAAPVAQPPAAGQVEIAVDGVTGGESQILLTMIHSGQPERPLGVACATIDSDPWSFNGLVYPIEGDHPCALGTTPVQLEPGNYSAFFGVYTGGKQSADQCVEVAFEVDGDTTVTAPAMDAPCNLYG